MKKAFDEAKGGILFNDEAYKLGKGKFAMAALTSLVEFMTKDEFEFSSFLYQAEKRS